MMKTKVSEPAGSMQSVYRPTREGFEIRNGTRYYNRPLYGSDHISMVLVGDRPAAMMNMAVHGGKMGNLHLALVSDQGEKWFHDFEQITATYIPGMMKYEISDRIIPGAKIVAEIVPLSDGPGFIVRVRGRKVPKNSKLIWMYGGASGYGQMVNALWQESYFKFAPQDCVDNDIEIRDGYFWLEGRNTRALQREDYVKDPQPGKKQVFGKTSLPGRYKICEATGVTFGPEYLFEKFGGYSIKTTNVPSVVVFASEPLRDSFEAYIVISCTEPVGEKLNDFKTVFDGAVGHFRAVAKKVEVKTPDIYLDRAAEAMNIAIDALWNPPCFSHGAWMWRCPYLGWEIYYGPEVSGWHDRVKTAIKAFCDKQLPNGSLPSNYNQTGDMYNMNEQFLDQVFYHYLWTGDRELVKEIFPALKRVLEWQDAQCDPDKDYLYTNSLNTWESDYQWYYGGACTQSSAYTWRAYEMLGQMAEAIGLNGRPWREKAGNIRKALFKTLWRKQEGNFAEYKDTFGLKRLHPETQQATVYVPIQCGVTDPFQSYQMLRWVENHLQPIISHGPGKNGKLYWSSNWRPTPPNGYQHTSRDPGLSISLNTALCWYRIGQTRPAYEMLMGAGLSCFMNGYPGTISYKAIGEHFEGGPPVTADMSVRPPGVDLANTVSLFMRNVVEGLFGVQPEMQKEQITLAPNFPSDWKRAYLKTGDIEINYQRTGRKETYRLRTSRSAKMLLKIIARGPGIRSIRLNGKKVAYKVYPAIGHGLIGVETGRLQEGILTVQYDQRRFEPLPVGTIAVAGQGYTFHTKQAGLVTFFDPQGILSDTSLVVKAFKGKISEKIGQHTFFIQVKDGDISFWKPLDIDIRRPLEIKNQDFNPATNLLSYQVHSNLAVNLNLETRSKFFGEEKQVKLRLPAHGQKKLSFRVSNKGLISPGKELLRVTALGDQSLVWEEPVINWNVFQGKPQRRRIFIKHCEPVPLKKLFNLKISEIFLQNYDQPKPGIRHWIRPNGLSVWNETTSSDDSLLRVHVTGGILLTRPGVPFQQVKEGKNAVFVSRWNNFPSRVEIPIRQKARKIYFLICGTTFPMQSHISNGQIIVQYDDGRTEQLNLTSPINYDDTLADFGYYHYAEQNASEILGRNTHADIIDMMTDSSRTIRSISLQALSNQVVIGLMGITLMR